MSCATRRPRDYIVPDLKRVADILGHRSVDTTVIYIKVDFDRLAQVALPWPDGKDVQS